MLRPAAFASFTFLLLCLSTWSSFTCTRAWGQGVPDFTMMRADGTELSSGDTVDFGISLQPGKSLNFTYKNTGTAMLEGIAFSVSGANPTTFRVINPTGVLLPGQSHTFKIEFTSVVASRTAILNVTSNDPDDSPFVLNLKGTITQRQIQLLEPSGEIISFFFTSYTTFNYVDLGSSVTKVYTLKNFRSTDLTDIVVRAEGSCAGDYIVTPPPSTIAPGASATFSVEFVPRVAGQRHTPLVIYSNDAEGLPYSLTMQGWGRAPDIRMYAHNGNDFWDVDIPDGGSASMDTVTLGKGGITTFGIVNEGVLDLTDLSVTMEGPHKDEFTITQALPVTQLAWQVSTSFVVTFTPTGLGPRSVVLHVASNDPDESPYDITLQATAVAPEISVKRPDGTDLPPGGTFDFGGMEVTKLVSQKLTVTNHGDSPLNISSTSRSGANANDFTITHGLVLGRLQPGESKACTVTFVAGAPGPRVGTLRIVSDDLDEGVYDFNVTGTGLQAELSVQQQPAGPPVLSGIPSSFGTMVLQGTRTLAFTLQNTGTAPLVRPVGTYLDGAHPGDFTFDFASSAPLAPGESTTMQVHFTPQAVGTRSATLRIPHNGSNPPGTNTLLPLTGTGTIAYVTLNTDRIRVNHGAAQVLVTLTRTLPDVEAVIRLETENGPTQAMPPISPATAGVDYTARSGADALVSFAAGEAEKTIAIPLLAPASGANENRHLCLTLVSTTPGIGPGAIPEATVLIAGADLVKPTLTLTTPAAGKLTGLLPLIVSGKAGDDKGLDRVEVKVDALPPVLATLGATNDRKAVPFTCEIHPGDGTRTLVVTAYDLRGNATTVTRSFSFTRKYPFTVEMRDVGTGELIANAASLAVTYTGGTPLIPNQPTAATRTTALADGTAVKIVATPAKGYALHHWSHTPLGPPQANIFTQGHIASFATLTSPQGNQSTTITLWVMPTPFNPPTGGSNTLHWYLPPDPLSPYTKLGGSLSATVTPSGSFSCKLTQAGVSYAFNGFFLGSGHALLIYKGHYATGIIFGGRSLRLRTYDGMTAPEAGFDSFTGPANIPWVRGRWGRYSATNKVPVLGLNPPAYTKGSYTMSLKPSDRLSPLPVAQPYPRGSGYASWTLTPLGQATLVGALADGTTFTSSSTLVRGVVNADDVAAPVFLELAPLGSTKKSILLAGDAIFDFSSTATVNGDFKWLRPASTDPKVNPYQQGWPGGFYLAGAGRMYIGSQDLQTSLMLGGYVPGQANASLTFTGGGLTSSVTKSSFAINKSAIVKVPPADASYTLTLVPATGLFSGTFSPNWSNPSTAKPAFKGILVQGVGAEGSFLHNAKTAISDSCGSVTLGAAVTPGM